MLESVVDIVQSTPLSYKFAIILGLLLVIASVSPPLMAAVLKQSLTLTRRQAQALGAIGLILIVAGSSGLYMANKPPKITNILPDEGKHTAGDMIVVTVYAFDPDKDNLTYEFRRKGPATNDRWIRVKGPLPDNSWSWETWPADRGLNYIDVIVYDEGDLNCSSLKEYGICPQNQPPEIKNLTATTLDSPWMMLEADAFDTDGDELAYKFSKFNIVNGSWGIICDWSKTDNCFWNRSGDDAGIKLIKVEVRDGLHQCTGIEGDAEKTLKLDESLRDDSGNSTGSASADAGNPDNSSDIGDNNTGEEI